MSTETTEYVPQAGEEVRLRAGFYEQHDKDDDGNPTVTTTYYNGLLTLREEDAARSDASLIFEPPEALEERAAAEAEAEQSDAESVREAENEWAGQGPPEPEEGTSELGPDGQPTYDTLVARLSEGTVEQAQEYLSDVEFTDDTLQLALQAEEEGKNRASLKTWIEEQLQP